MGALGPIFGRRSEWLEFIDSNKWLACPYVDGDSTDFAFRTLGSDRCLSCNARYLDLPAQLDHKEILMGWRLWERLFSMRDLFQWLTEALFDPAIDVHPTVFLFFAHQRV